MTRASGRKGGKKKKLSRMGWKEIMRRREEGKEK
jgi:hypothetical protein